ncbi:MAG: DUF4446 family protein [Selenomonadaceae bacterium]|nr:DUF4446 family protein [Selenomonadaceae bacterium]MBR1579895.1 DUF4446 family protein [Selenomonadaceae bacterium]
MNAAAVLTDNPLYVIIAFGVMMLISYAIIINLWMELSTVKKRYRQMMAGVEGSNLERMIAEHIELAESISNDRKSFQKEIDRLDAKLVKAITRLSVVRFDAFEDVGSDLSYCIAMLDEENNGIVISGIFGRDEARTYAKPIVKGESTYKLTREEEQALRNAMNK